MIFYSITLEKRTLDWAGTQADARASQKQHAAIHQGEIVTWQEEEVPTDKPKLLAWLKERVTHPSTNQEMSGEQ